MELRTACACRPNDGPGGRAAETALELAAALGTSAEVWLRLDAAHWLRVAEERPEMAAARRAILRRSRAQAGGPPRRGRGGGRE